MSVKLSPKTGGGKFDSTNDLTCSNPPPSQTDTTFFQSYFHQHLVLLVNFSQFPLFFFCNEEIQNFPESFCCSLPYFLHMLAILGYFSQGFNIN